MRNILLVALILLCGRIIYFTEPYGVSVDESTYLAVAEAWDFYGTPYVDGVDRKPPLLYGLYWAIGKVFGFFHIHGVHITFFLLTLLLCFQGARLSKKLYPDIPSGFVAVLIAVLSSSFAREFISSNGEIASLPFFFLAASLLLDASRASAFRKVLVLALISGFFAAAGTAMKQVIAVPYASLVFGLSLFLWKQNLLKRTAVLWAGMGLGVAICYAMITAYFWKIGALEDFLRWNLLDNFSYVRDGTRLPAADRPIFSALFISFAAWPVLWWGFIYRLLKKKNQGWEVADYFSIAALVGGWLLIALSGRLFAHYFVPLGFILAVVSARGVLDLIRHPRLRVWALACLAIPFSICALLTTFRDQIQVHFYKPATFSQPVQKRLERVAEKIKEVSQPGDRLVVWGMASQLYVLSGRGSGTRFIPADYVSGRLGGFESAAKHPFVAENMALYLSDLETKHPKVLIDTAEAGLNDYQYFPLRDYPELNAYLQNHYTYQGAVEGFGLWLRQD